MRDRGADDHRSRRELQEELDEWAADVVDGGIGLARLAIGGAVRTARWSLGRSWEIAEQVVDAVARGQPVTAATGRAASDARHAFMEFTGLEDPAEDDDGGQGPRRRSTDAADAAELRRRGAALLRRAADVGDDVDVHPAYPRILEEISPDEARILRLLAEQGPQAAVDVRTSTPIPGASELVGAGMTMIGALAGCRHPDRVPAYLNNLHRLGLAWFSREQLDDPAAYQVLEAQPEVVAAIESVRRARTVHRSVELTPFGEDFVATCLLGPPTG